MYLSLVGGKFVLDAGAKEYINHSSFMWHYFVLNRIWPVVVVEFSGGRLMCKWIRNIAYMGLAC